MNTHVTFFGLKNIIVLLCLVNLFLHLQALNEAHRVLAPGGRFMCLEFSTVTIPILERYFIKFFELTLKTMSRCIRWILFF